METTKILGIICTIIGGLMILVYIFCNNLEENSKTGKIIFWIGTCFALAGAAMLTVYYCVPQKEPEHVPTVYERYTALYKEENYTSYIDTDNYKVYGVTHQELYTTDIEDEGNPYKVTSFKTEVCYIDYNEPIDSKCGRILTLLDSYVYNTDFSYQFIQTVVLHEVA